MPLETTLSAADGTPLFVRHYPAGSARHRRTLVIVHGASEHGGRYDHIARAAVSRGWNVVVPDLRGHGLSGGTPVHVASFEQYLDDLDRVFSHFRLVSNETAVLGHSMGGLIVIRFLQTRPDAVVALVAASPLLGLSTPVPRFTRLLGRLMSVVAPRTRFLSRVDPAFLTRDADCLERRKTDPLVHPAVTAGWFYSALAAIGEALAQAPQMTIPTLVLHGAADRVTDVLAAQQWFEAAGSRDKTYRLIPDHLHELLNEPDWPETLSLVLDWLETRVPSSRRDASD